jgi:hypothetical protein
MEKYNYTKDKICTAVLLLASNTGAIKERISNAFSIIHSLSEKDFDTDLKEDWNFIYGNIAKNFPLSQQSVTSDSIFSTIDKMDELTCKLIAERICILDYKLRLN